MHDPYERNEPCNGLHDEPTKPMTTNDGWILCSERLPHNTQSYCVQLNDGSMAVILFTGRWQSGEPERIIRWFQVPKPPEIKKPRTLADKIYVDYVVANGGQESGFVQGAIQFTIDWMAKMPIDHHAQLEICNAWGRGEPQSIFNAWIKGQETLLERITK